jgi:hypothetical protein
VAAGLKLYGLQVSAVPRIGPLYAPWVQMAVLQWEIILGLWLVSGWYPLGSWLAAVGTFAAFAAVSGYLGWAGQAGCGCFGSVEASPWHAFAVDVLILLTLAWVRPDWRLLLEHPRLALRRAGGTALAFFAGAAVLFSLLAGLGAWMFGSLDAALAHIRGERVSVRPGFVDLGSGAPGQSVATTVELVNRTDRPVRIIGGTSDCSCVTTNDLPVTLAPGESRPVSIRVGLPTTPGLFNRQAFFWTDDDQARAIVFPLSGRINCTALRLGCQRSP